MAIGRSAVLLSALAVGALLTTGSTYAAFSDNAEITGNQVAAGTVVVGGEGGAAPDLGYSGLTPGHSATDTMRLRYAGSIAADLWLELQPGTVADAFCTKGDDWAAKPGGALQIRVGGGTWLDYCTALSGQRLTIADAVQPSTTLDVQVDVRLFDGTDARYSGLSGVDGLLVKALQTGGQGFSDYASGTVTISDGTIAPAVPQQCRDAGLTDYDASNTVYLTDDDDTFDAGKTPQHGRGYLIFGLGGDDVITGSNQADCIVGGAGDDYLVGGNQDDVLLGGDGDDVLNGPADDESSEAAGPGDKPGGNGKDTLYGGAGDDVLHGANGKDHLDGGDDVHGDVCIDEPNGQHPNRDDGAHGNPGGNGEDTFVGCEFDGVTPAGRSATALVASAAQGGNAAAPDGAAATGDASATGDAVSTGDAVATGDGTASAGGGADAEGTSTRDGTATPTPSATPPVSGDAAGGSSDGARAGEADSSATSSATTAPSTQPTVAFAG